jgi:hypothetical protein
MRLPQPRGQLAGGGAAVGGCPSASKGRPQRDLWAVTEAENQPPVGHSAPGFPAAFASAPASPLGSPPLGIPPLGIPPLGIPPLGVPPLGVPPVPGGTSGTQEMLPTSFCPGSHGSILLHPATKTKVRIKVFIGAFRDRPDRLHFLLHCREFAQ